MSTATKLAAMFEDDRSMSAAFWFTRHLPYEFDAEVGARPWWPSLSEVWLAQGEAPPPDGTAASLAWPEAWDSLQGLHADYQASRRSA